MRSFQNAALQAQYLLDEYLNFNTTPHPKSGLELYTMKEDLRNHILQCLAIVDTRIPTSFFSNVYVKTRLRQLNDRQRSTYWLKTLRIIWCINDVLTEESFLLITEEFLNYSQSFVSSTSDFWWDGVRKKSFGASVANFMSNRYIFRNGQVLFMSDTTRKKVHETELRHNGGVRDRYQALLDCLKLPKAHTGEKIGNWLNTIHAGDGCKPSYIGGHVLDGVKNARKSVEQLEFMTEDECPQYIITNTCDAH